MSEININQIYHTSHCGSTLMATLLANSTTVYCEPKWSSDLLLSKDLNIVKNFNDITIKFGSGYCPFAKNLFGKKIFLYRKLNHHLFKIKTSNYIAHIVSTKYEHHLTHCHPLLKAHQFETDLEKIAFMWLNNILWIKEVNDILWIESNSFFENKKETMNIVCDYLNLDRVKNFELSTVYVKSFGLIGNENPINQVQIPNLGQIKSLYPSYGIIETYMVSYDEQIRTISDWVENNFLELKEFLY